MPSAAEARALFRAFMREGTSYIHPQLHVLDLPPIPSLNLWRLSLLPHTLTARPPPPFTGSKFPNYNIREYVRRRAREQFKEASKVSDEGQSMELWSKGKETIEMVKRQAVVYQLYARKQKSVMDM